MARELKLNRLMGKFLEGRVFRVGQVAGLLFSANALAGTITHQALDERGGRLVFNFGNSASYTVVNRTAEIQVQLDPDTVTDLSMNYEDAIVSRNCEARIERPNALIRFQCPNADFTQMNSSYLRQPNRFVVEFKLALRATKVAQKRTSKIAPKKQKTTKQVAAPQVDLQPVVQEPNQMALIKGRYQVYLKYKTLRQPVYFEYQLPAFPVLNHSDQVTDLYNIALQAFRKKHYALALKTINFARHADPNHAAWLHMAFLEAECYVKLAEELEAPKYFQEAISLYKIAIGKYPDSIYSEPAITHLGYLQLERKDFYGAIATYIFAVDIKKEAKSRTQWELGIAEAMLNQNRFEEARQYYLKLSRQEVDETRRLEGIYRLGDSFAMQSRYKEAISFYGYSMGYETLNSVNVEVHFENHKGFFPTTLRNFPSVPFNLAEAYFWTENYEKALYYYRFFVEHYSLHENRALAFSRIGEIESLFQKPEVEVRGAYMEAIFRYPDSLGADLASLRIAEMDLAATEKGLIAHATKVIDTLEKKYKKDPDMTDFIVLLKAKAAFQRRSYLDAFHFLQTQFLRNPKRPYASSFKQYIYRSLSLGFRELRRNGKCSELFDTYWDRKTIWFSGENPYFDSNLELAICGLKGSSPKLTLQFLDHYEKKLADAKEKPEAWGYLQHIQSIAPKSEIEFYRGFASLKFGQLEKATTHFQNAIKAAREEPQTMVSDVSHLYLGLAFTQLRQLDNAKLALEKVKEKSVYRSFIFEVMSQAQDLKVDGHYDFAIRVLDELLRTTTTPSTQIPMWIAKAEMLWRTSQRSPASEIYESVIALSNEQQRFDLSGTTIEHEALSDEFETTDDRVGNLISGTRSSFKHVESLSEIQALSAYRVGLNFNDQGKIESSIEYFKKSMSFAPKSTWAIASESELNTIAFKKKYDETIMKQIGTEKSNKKRGPQ